MYDEDVDILRMGYTLNGANDTVVDLDSNALAVSVQGSLGIGTTTPRDVEHIWKDGSNGDHGLLIEQNNAGTGSATLKFGVAHTTESTTGLSKAGIFFKRADTKGRGDLLFCVDNADDTNDVDTSNHAMTIYRDGNVGIGTTSPGGTLDIESSAAGQTAVLPPTTQLVLSCDDANAGDPGDLGAGLTFKQRWYNSNATRTATGGIYGVKTNSNGSYGGGLAFFRGPAGTNNLTEAMRIDHNGNIGIGTTGPNRQLQIYGDSSNYFSFSPTEADDTSIVDNTNFGATSFRKQMMMRLNNRTWYWGIVNNASNCLGLGADGGGGNDPDIQCVFQNNGTFWTKNVRTSGNVGIGTQTPYAKLQVNGSGGSLTSSQHYGFRPSQSFTDYGVGIHNTVSIYANDDIVSGAYVLAHGGTMGSSDERIKKNIVDADDAECLETLRLLKPKKYQYRDVVERGEEPVWGFIAQEVRDTLPYATQLTKDCLLYTSPSPRDKRQSRMPSSA